MLNPLPGIAAIDIQSVVKQYRGHRALQGVDLRIEQGEFFGLLGPNGAGKTTLISIMAGLVHATAGQVSIMGADVRRDFRRARMALGVVPQELVFDPFFTVRELLQMQSGYFGLRRNEAWIDELLHELGLSDKANTNMRALSGGMKRRVLVAQALVHRPAVIVLDEPTAGVDVELRQGLWQFIRRLNQQGHTIVLTTHYLEEAETLCHRIAMMKAGRVVACDQTRKLMAHAHGLTLRLSVRREALPESLKPYWLASESLPGRPVFRVPEAQWVEKVLAELRQAGCELDDIEVQRPDLESAFLSLMQEKGEV